MSRKDRDKRGENIKKALQEAKARGQKLGRPKAVSDARIRRWMHLPTGEAVKKLGISRNQLTRRRAKLESEAQKEQRMKAHGRTGRRQPSVPDSEIEKVIDLETREAAARVGLSVSQFVKRRRRIRERSEE